VLARFLKTVIKLGADELDFEYKGSELVVFAISGSTGVGIGWVESNSKDCRRLIDQIMSAKKSKRVEIAGVTWGIFVSTYDSSGETAWRVKLAAPTKGA